MSGSNLPHPKAQFRRAYRLVRKHNSVGVRQGPDFFALPAQARAAAGHAWFGKDDPLEERRFRVENTRRRFDTKLARNFPLI